jgi:ribosomal protein S18 acetylase RimI-like enzyme
MTMQDAVSRRAGAELLVRRVGIEDAMTVHTLVLELAAHEKSAHAVHSSVDDWERMLADPRVLVLVAELEGRPVGYVSGVRQLNLWLGRDLFAMDDLYVRAEARDRGIGGRLMAALAEHVHDDRLVITWGVNEENDAGQRFYRRLGARLRTKTVASWQPHDYEAHLTVALAHGARG